MLKISYTAITEINIKFLIWISLSINNIIGFSESENKISNKKIFPLANHGIIASVFKHHLKTEGVSLQSFAPFCIKDVKHSYYTTNHEAMSRTLDVQCTHVPVT